nr:bifunctional DNA primase/polymerase [Streptomyces sp. NBC_00974]
MAAPSHPAPRAAARAACWARGRHRLPGLPRRRHGLDVHGDEDEPGVLAALADRLGETVPETFTVATPSGGRHLRYRAPMGCTIGSTSGRRTALGPGIDIRGPGHRSGGYLVGTGSHVDGRPYGIVRDVPVAPLPDWFAALLTPQGGHGWRPRRRGADARVPGCGARTPPPRLTRLSGGWSATGCRSP